MLNTYCIPYWTLHCELFCIFFCMENQLHCRVQWVLQCTLQSTVHFSVACTCFSIVIFFWEEAISASHTDVCLPYRGMFSVDNCLWMWVVYTEHDYHLILGFKLSSQIGFHLKLGFKKRLSTQTVIFILNLISRNSYLHWTFLYFTVQPTVQYSVQFTVHYAVQCHDSE